jgi:hypothetical protein
MKVSDAKEKADKLYPYFRNAQTSEFLDMKAPIKTYIDMFNNFKVEIFWTQQL